MEYKKIAAECGVISERGEKQIAIISNDMVWMALLMLRCVLGLAKLTLLVFGLVARVFLVFAKAVVD